MVTSRPTGQALTREYTHELNKEVRSISGSYELEKEGTVRVAGREVLYAVGNALVDGSCCGSWGCRYAVVPGWVIRWKYVDNSEGTPISQVEPVTDEDVKRQVTRLLETEEGVTQVRFW
jgi:hypothetical protein